MIRSDKSPCTYASVHLSPKEQIGIHTQPNWELSQILVGSGIRHIGNQTEPFQRGEVVLVPPGIPHGWIFDPNDTDPRGEICNITVTFTDSFLTHCASAFHQWQAPIAKLRSNPYAVKFGSALAVRLGSLLKEMRTQSEAERIASTLRLLLIATDEREQIGRELRSGKVQSRLDQIRTYVICNQHRGITLDQIARHVGMNRSSFCIFFKRATDRSFVTYLNECRIEQACRLLTEQTASISDICYQVGFNNVPYFNRIFRRQVGCTPSDYVARSTSQQ